MAKKRSDNIKKSSTKKSTVKKSAVKKASPIKKSSVKKTSTTKKSSSGKSIKKVKKIVSNGFSKPSFAKSSFSSFSVKRSFFSPVTDYLKKITGKYYYPGSKLYNRIEALKYFFKRYKKQILMALGALFLIILILLMVKGCGGSSGGVRDFRSQEQAIFQKIYQDYTEKDNFDDLKKLYNDFDKDKKQQLAEKLANYQRRIEKYPEEPENYQKMSELFENLEDYPDSEKFYDLYQKVKALKNEKDEGKRNRELQKLLRGISKNGGNSRSDNNNTTINENISKNQKSKTLSESDIADTKDPNEKKAKSLYNQGVKYHNQKNYPKAIDKLQQAIKVKDDFAPAYSQIAQSYLAEDDINNAIKNAKIALRLDDSDDKAAFTMGEAYRALKDDDNAEAFYRQAIANNDNHLLAYFRLANLKFKRARQNINKDANINEARRLYNKCLEIDYKFYKAGMNLGMSYMYGDDQLSKAITVFKKTLSLASIKNDKTSMFIVNNSLGQSYFNRKEYKNAIKYFNKALTYKKHFKVLFTLGITYEKRGDLSKAKKFYKEALLKKPGYKEASFNLGNVYLHEKKYSEALTLFNKIIQNDPGFIEACVNAGKCKIALGQNDEAKRYFDIAYKKAPNNPTANIELAKYWKHKHSLDLAVKHAKIALKNESSEEDKIIYYNELGLIYFNEQIYNEAERYLLIAKGINPAGQATLENLGNVYLKQDKYSEAKIIYENITKVNSRAYDAYFILAGILDKLGDSPAAKETYQRLLKLKPNYSKKTEIEKYINSH